MGQEKASEGKGGIRVIYDSIDMLSKIGITHVCKRWVSRISPETGNMENRDILKGVCQKYNIFGTIIPMNAEDGDLWRLLMLIGAGAITPILTTDCNYVLGLRDKWEIPGWVYNQASWKNLSLHVEQMLEAHDSAEVLNARKLIMRRSAEMFNDQRIVASPPREPNTDWHKELEKMESLKTQGGLLHREWRSRLHGRKKNRSS